MISKENIPYFEISYASVTKNQGLGKRTCFLEAILKK